MPSNRRLSDLLSGRSSINVSVWGKNKNTNHHSKCTCYFPSGVRNWIASESRENAADGLGLELVSPHAVGREKETWHGSWPVWRGWALRGPIPRSWRSPPHCQMPDAAGAAVLAVPVAPVHSGKQRLTLSVCRHSLATQLQWCRGKIGGEWGSSACWYCFLAVQTGPVTHQGSE